jgi:hypothetical protein
MTDGRRGRALGMHVLRARGRRKRKATQDNEREDREKDDTRERKTNTDKHDGKYHIREAVITLSTVVVKRCRM